MCSKYLQFTRKYSSSIWSYSKKCFVTTNRTCGMVDMLQNTFWHIWKRLDEIVTTILIFFEKFKFMYLKTTWWNLHANYLYCFDERINNESDDAQKERTNLFCCKNRGRSANSMWITWYIWSETQNNSFLTLNSTDWFTWSILLTFEWFLQSLRQMIHTKSWIFRIENIFFRTKCQRSTRICFDKNTSFVSDCCTINFVQTIGSRNNRRGYEK